MKAEYLTDSSKPKAPNGKGWYVLGEDGTILSGNFGENKAAALDWIANEQAPNQPKTTWEPPSPF